MEPIDTSNKYAVSIHGMRVIIQLPPLGSISHDDALLAGGLDRCHHWQGETVCADLEGGTGFLEKENPNGRPSCNDPDHLQDAWPRSRQRRNVAKRISRRSNATSRAAMGGRPA